MDFPPAVLDHVVVDVGEAIDEATGIYRGLGFQMTPIGRHSLGTVNRLAMFQSNYLELLGYERGVANLRADVAGFPAGLNGLVFATEDSAAVYAAMTANGVPIQEPVEFFRPVELPGGKQEDARFRTVRLPRGTIPAGRVYFCHHLTRNLVWRDEWLSHANGAAAVAGVIIAAENPETTAAVLEKMFGPTALSRSAGGAALAMTNARLDIMTPDGLAQRYGNSAPDPSGRTDYMAALILKAVSRAKAAQVLRGSATVVDGDRIIVPADRACNVTLEFIA
jgi:hypothetical protein